MVFLLGLAFVLAKIEVKAEVSRKLRSDKNREEFFFPLRFEDMSCESLGVIRSPIFKDEAQYGLFKDEA